MKFRKCAAAGVLALCLAAAGPLSALAGQSAGPGQLTSFCQWGEHLCQQNGQYADAETVCLTIGTWPVKLGRRSETGDKVQEGGRNTPSGSISKPWGMGQYRQGLFLPATPAADGP